MRSARSQRLQGQAAIEQAPQVEAKLDEQKQQIRSGLQDGGQRRAWDAFIAKEDADTKLTIGKHVAAQQAVFQNQAAAGQIVSFKQQAAAGPTCEPAVLGCRCNRPPRV